MSPAAAEVGRHPFAFAVAVVKSFFRNQGLLLAGAIAYYALLSAVPLLILAIVVLSPLLATGELLEALSRYLEWAVPSQSRAVLADVQSVLDDRAAIGSLLFVTLLFFSSLAFSVMEKALVVIFGHRPGCRDRHFLISAVLPYCFVLVLGIGLLVLSGTVAALEALAGEQVRWLGREWSLAGFSGALLYLGGFLFEAMLFAGLYLVLPAGGVKVSHACLGGLAAAVLWEFLRHGLAWYFVRISKVGVVYGSLATAVVILLSLEIAATVFLLGAQVIAEYERLGGSMPNPAPAGDSP